jgi:hypothetical protein
LKFIFFALNIFLEYNIFPRYLTSFLKINCISFYCAVIICMFTKFNFRKYNKLMVIVIAALDLFCGFYLVNVVHNVKRDLTDISHYIFILSFLMIPFIFYDDEEAYSQIKKSNFFKEFFNFIITIITVGFYHSHFNFLYLPSARHENFSDWKKFLINYGVTFVVFYTANTLTALTKYYYSKSKKKILLVQILKRILVLILITASFYLNSNLAITDYIKTKFNEWVPQPHNLIIYNTIPHDLDTRFRMIVTTLMYSIL